MFVRFWGTRGSIPTPGNKTRRYGGNTSCVEVTTGEKLLVFDAGTGLRELGQDLLARQLEHVEAHLFFSHTHWDHIQGFPFFTPAYHATSTLQFYEISPEDERFARLVQSQMRTDFFPVGFADLGARLVPRYFENQRVEIDETVVHCLEQPHPGRSFAYRVESAGHSVVYATDSELDRLLDNHDTSRRNWDEWRVVPRTYSDFVRNVDLLIADAQYTDEEYERKAGWGHSRINTVVDLAVASGVQRLALFHHDPLHSDDHLDILVEQARQRAQMRGSALDVFAAREGLTLRIA